jgi:Tol biopolymer transport system component
LNPRDENAAQDVAVVGIGEKNVSLEIGQKLSHYVLAEKIGEGGMGQVYRAQDTRLGRDVAIKVLPEAFAQDAERVARFEREARTLASIQHSNIASIHGFDESGGHRYLVMELAEGEDLSERLSRGRLEMDEALGIAHQIALGLQAAHDVGIVHRDLKPANVVIGAEGQVKILDFGLARVFGDDGDEQDLKESPTITGHMTRAGVILGTAAYMSPEQARGKRIDRRADIWAFGCVLFELLTGKQAFPGETVSDVIAKIIQGEPRWADLPDATPPTLRKLLRRCLQRDAGNRLHDIADARLEIDDIVAGAEEPAGVGAAVPAPRRRGVTWLPWLVLLAVAVAWGVTQVTRTPSERRMTQFEVPTPPQHRVWEFCVSPDGTALAFVAIDRDRTPRLWLRKFDSTEQRPLDGTEGAFFPFWSPDSRSLAFFAGGKLRRIDVASETIQTIADAPNGRGGAWSADDVIVFTPEGRDGLYRVSASGGEVTPLTMLSGEEDSHRVPHFLPDGQRFIYVVQNLGGRTGTRMLGSIASSNPAVKLMDGTSEVYASSGYLLFVRELTLMAQRFDASKGTLVGQPVPVASDIAEAFPRWGRTSFSASSNEVLAYYEAKLGDSELVWFNRNGRRLEAASSPGVHSVTNAPPRMGPKGQRVGFVRGGPSARFDFAIWILDLERGTSTRATPGSEELVSFAWSHDGATLFRSMGGTIERMRIGDASSPETLWSASAPGTADPTLPSWIGGLDVASDGSFVVLMGWNSQTDMDVWRMNLDDEHALVPLARGPQSQRAAQVSPDGRWVVHESEESGRAEIYVSSASDGAGKTLISTGGGADPHWSRNGEELYYIAPDRQLMVARVRSGATFEAGRPEALFEAPGSTIQNDANPLLVAADGERFLFDVPVTAKQPTITVVLNWDLMLPE